MSDFRSLLSSFQDATGSSASSNVRTSSTSATNKKRPQQQQESLSKKNKTAQKEDIDRLWRTSQIKTSFAASSSSSKKVTQKESTTKIDDTRGSGPLCGAGASTTTTPAIHVAICATIVSELPHEEIWRTWSSHHPENDSTSASIHVHAKTPSLIPNNSWLKSRLIPISHNPNWNDYRIILAMLSLAEYAIKEQPNTTHIMMVTESCIPIGSLDELTNIIIKEGSVSADGGLLLDQSFLDVYGIDSSRCTRFDEHACFSINDIPKDAIYKALPGWALFSRSHMEEMMNIKDRFNGGGELYPLFKSVWAPEEVYFPTALALLGKLSGNDQVVRRSLMWSKWDANIKGKDRAHPIVYDGQFCKKIVDDVKAEGCIFMRKWKKRLNYRQWESIVLNNTSTSIREANKQNNASKRSREESESGNNTTSMISKRQKSSVRNGDT